MGSKCPLKAIIFDNNLVAVTSLRFWDGRDLHRGFRSLWQPELIGDQSNQFHSTGKFTHSRGLTIRIKEQTGYGAHMRIHKFQI